MISAVMQQNSLPRRVVHSLLDELEQDGHLLRDSLGDFYTKQRIILGNL